MQDQLSPYSLWFINFQNHANGPSARRRSDVPGPLAPCTTTSQGNADQDAEGPYTVHVQAAGLVENHIRR